jgi:acyl transferase domain-containing protein
MVDPQIGTRGPPSTAGPPGDHRQPVTGSKRMEELSSSGRAIAIVGMAGRFPGAPGVRELWRNLREGIESIRPLSRGELEAAGVPSRTLDDPSYVRAGAPLEEMDGFDAGFFGFSPRDAAILDPQHRHFLEVSWAALEDSGHLPERFPGAIGVFAGSGANAYLWANLMTNPDLAQDVGFFLLRHTGNDKDFLATGVSYALDLTGPSISVQTACSTSLVAVHMAIQSLLAGESDMALAGASTIMQPHGVGYRHSRGEIGSIDGHCRAFDASASGGVFGSGVGVVVLRRLEDAARDGDTIHAVLLGSAVNNDGSGKVSYLAPSVDGQALAIEEALAFAGVGPASIQYVEAHGSGTAMGDPIEVAALTRAFRRGTLERAFCGLGSIKTNIGHLDTAAGVAGLIKVVQALRHRAIPPTLNFAVPNPLLELEESPFFVNAELRPWEAEGPRRAGVNSLGVGGTNAFVVVEEAPPMPASHPSRSVQLLPLSGRSRQVVETAASRLALHLEEERTEPLADVAYTLALGRRAFRHRRAVVAATSEEAVPAIRSGDPARVVSGEAPEASPGVTFLFAGGGAQYPLMGADLYREEEAYRTVVDACLDRVSTPLAARLSWVLVEADPGDLEARAALLRPSLALPALFITQVAQATLWMSWGIRPDAMIGHSLGEYTAACLSGVFTLSDALALVVTRGRLFEEVAEGGMLSVPLSEAELRPLLSPLLSIAAVNAPELCVASGPPEALAELEAVLVERGVESRRVRISVGAHSAMLSPILREFEENVRSVHLASPSIPFISNLTGEWITAGEATDPGYWARQLRQTVRFSDGLRTLLGEASGTLVEVGPGRTLATLARLNTLQGRRPAEVQGSMRGHDEVGHDLAVQLGVLARLWVRGVDVDWDNYFGSQRRRRVSLPTYAFEHQPYFVSPGNGVPLQLSPDATDGSSNGSSRSAPNGSGPDWSPAPAREEWTAPPDLGRLQKALVAHPGVIDAAATVRMEASGEARVVAFFVRDPSSAGTVTELRRHLRNELPMALVPQGLVEVPEIPRSADGEVQSDRLFDPFAANGNHVAPRTRTERTIADIWKRLLGVEEVNLHDNFLDVGGHSLLGIRVLKEVEDLLGVELNPNTLARQTLVQVASECDRLSGNGGSPDSPRAGGVVNRWVAAVRQSVTGA